MASTSAQSRIDRSTYIPPHIQQDMTRHMQQNMPAHLKKYVGENAAYVPKHMEATLAKAMERNMPAHLKKYSGAYMEQKVVQPNTARLHTSATLGKQSVHGNVQPQVNPASHRVFKPPAEGVDTDKLFEEHQLNQQAQATSQPGIRTDAAWPQQSVQDAQQNMQQGVQQNPPNTQYNPNNPYDFIMSPEQPKKPTFNFNASLPVKIAAGLGALLLLFIVGSIIKNLVFGSGDVPQSYVTVAQDQQAMLVILQNKDNEQNLDESTKAFVTTANLSLSSSQSELIKYLALNKKEVSPKDLALKTDAASTKQLQDSIAASTYDQTFREIMKTKLTKYKQQLQTAYTEFDGQKGQALLDDSFDQAELLLDQLEATKS